MWLDRSEHRFRTWFAAQQARRDAALAVLYLTLAADCCIWQASKRLHAGSTALQPILSMLPMLLICAGILVLQVHAPPLAPARILCTFADILHLVSFTSLNR